MQLLQKNGQISSLNGIAEEQVALSLKPEELNGQKTDVAITDVAQRETATTIQKEESVENMEIKLSESSDKTNADIEQKDTQGIDQLSPSAEDKVEEQGQPSESLSSDVGFKKVFKLVGFKFTVRKDKTEKVEPVQLVNVKTDGEAEVASGGGGDSKEVKTETVDEATQSEVLNPVEKTEQETQTDQKKEESLPETITESPLEAESKQEEVKNDGTKSPESPTSPVTTETASPLRKFFTQGWAGFRKKTSFRKPKEEEQQAIEKDIEEQVKEVAEEETAIGEELEKEKPVPEKDQTEISMEVSDVKAEKETEDTKMVDVSTETHGEDAVMPREQPSTNESAEPEIKEPEISLKEKSDLASEEVSTQTEECLMAPEQSTLAPSEKEPEATALLAGEAPEGQTDQSDLTSPMAIEMVEEPFEIIEADKSEPEASVLTEMLDEKSTEMSTDSSTIEKKEEPETTPKEELVLEQLVETVNETESGQSTEEQLTVKDTSPEDVNEHLKQTEPSTVAAATSKPPEGITNEVELLSSQERAKIQGSPLKKLFTSSSLKKLSGKKRKGKKEAAKSGEAGEQMQQLSDSAESPEDPRGESSASSPEEATDSVEKVDASQNTESEEGSALDVEKKRESVTPWASFKKMVTPKKRVRRLSESDKEDELDKAKTTTLSSTESGPSEEQEEIKEIAEEQKLEKSTEEPKRKVDTSVSWEALICVGSSKRRSRKSSSSDEEVGQRLAQEGQKIDEGVPNKEVAAEATLTSSHESDQGQGNSSPEQVGSPSEGEGVSTWESFKRLVTPRRKSKTRMEEKSEESATVPSLEHSTSDTDSGKEESWVSFKKLMPGRRKKKSDGVPEHAPVQESGEEMAETNEEDYDVPAVVPLSEYEAAEQEKFEAQMAKQVDKAEKNLEEEKEKPGDAITEQSNEGLMHAVTVTVVEGERAVTSIEERSPSWISAAVTESIEQANEDEERKTEPISETGVVEETVVDTKLMPEIKKDISGDTIVSELTSEAITAREEPSGVEEGTEISCAEETTEMVSAVSRLSESPDTTEIATPVQEVEENQEELNKQTQEILQEVAERVQVTDEASVVCEIISEVVVQPVSVVKPAVIIQGAELSEMPLKEEEAIKTDIQTDGGMKSNEGQVEVKEGDLKEILEQQKDVCMEVPGSTVVTYTLDRTDESDHPKSEQEIVEESEKNLEKQKIDEKSDDEDEFVIVTVTPEKEQKVTDGDTTEKKEMLLKEMDSGEYGPTSVVREVRMTVEATTPVMIINVPKVDELMKVTCEEKPQLSPKQEKIVDIVPDWQSEPTEQGTIEVKKPLLQNELQEADILIESPDTGEFVPEAPTQSKIIEVIVKDGETKVQDVDVAREAVLGAKTGSAEEVAVEEQVHGETVETEVPIRKLEVDVPKQKAVAEDYVQRMVTDGHLEEMEKKTDMQSIEDVMVVKPEVKDMETKTEYIVEKTDVPEPVKVAETHITVQGVHTVLAVDIEEVTKTTDLVSEALTEKDEVEPLVKALTEETGVMMDMGAVTKKAGTKVEVLTATEGVVSKIDVEASTKEADAKVEGMIPEEMVTSSGQACGKLEKEVPKAVMDMESRVETSGAEIAEKEKAGAKVEMVSATEEVASKTDVEASTREADAKVEGMLPEEKVTSSGQAGGKLEKEVPKAVMDMESSVKTSGTEVAEKESAGSKVEVVTVTEEVASKEVASIEEADTKIEGMMSEEMMTSLGQAGEKLEKEVPKAFVDMECSVETSGPEVAEKESAGSKVAVVTITEEVASKTDVGASTKEADTKIEGMMSEEMVTSSVQAGEKLEKEVPKAFVDMECRVETSGTEVAEKETAGAKVEVVSATQEVASKIDVKASTEEADTKVEGLIPEEKVTSSVQAGGKLEKEVPEAVVGMESSVKTSGPEVAEKETGGAKEEVVTVTKEVASKIDVETSTKEADTKIESMVSEEMVTSSGQAGEKLEKEVPKAVVDMESNVETSGAEVAEKEKAGAKVEVVSATEEVASKIDVEASTKEADTKVEGLIPEEKVTSSGQAGGKLEKEVPEAVVGMESSVKTSGPEVAEKETAGAKVEVVSATQEVASKIDVKASTEEADTKVEGLIPEEKVMSSGQAGGKLEKEVPEAVVGMESSVKTSGPEVAEKETAGAKVEVVTVTKEVASKIDVEASTKEADTKIEGMVSEEMVTSSGQAGEKLEKEVPKAVVDMESNVETSGAEVAEKEKAGAKVEVVSATEEVSSKIDVEASTKEADTKVEGLIPEEKVTSSGQAGGKLEKEVPEAVVGMESSVKTSGPEVAEKKSEMEVPPENTDMDHSTEEAKVVSSSEKSDTEILTKKAEPEVPIEKTEVKACEEIIREKVDAEVAMMDPAKKVDEKDPAKQSEVLAKAEVTAEQPEKETSEEIQKEIVFLSDVEGAASSLVMCAEPVSAEASLDISTGQELVSKVMTKVPLQTETPNVAISLESKTPDALVTVTLSESKVKDGAPALGEVAMVQTGTEAPKERGLDERSVSKEDTVDLTQAVVGDARLILRSQIPEGIKADAPESKDKVSANDVILVETKLDKESIIQKEISIPHIKTEEEALTFRDTTDSEGHLQSEKEEALCLESRYTKAAENIVQSEATGDTTKIEIGKGHLATELDPTELVMLETVVEGSILSDTGYLNSEVSNAVLENMSDGTPLGSSEVSQNRITVPTETCPDKLPLEAVPQVLEHTATSDSYQTKQGLSEKAQIKEEEKSSESIELASGDVCHANSVQQEVFTEQQAAVTISIPEVPSCTAYKSSVTLTAAEVEEQIIAENIASAAASNETLQPLPEEQPETEFKLVQQVSFAHSVCGTIDPDTEIVSKKTDSTLEKPVSPTVSRTKDDLLQKCVFHPIPEMKHQKPETSQEAGEKTTTRERSQSLTHIEFQKDVVQSVTIESQSTKIILKIIQNAVDKLEETEVTKQQSGSHLVEADKSESLQPFVKGKEERSQEIQASSITQPAEKQYAFKTVEEMPLHSEKSDDEKSADSSKPKAVKHTSHIDEERCTVATLEEHPGFPSEVTTLIIKEKGLQQENGEPKDTAVSTETQRDILEGIVSVDVPKESLGLDQPKLKDTEVGQTIQNREQLSEQQTHVKRKDESPLTETVERDVNNQGCTSCKSPQLKSEVAES
ncbi:hypothetical protein JRQ81_008457 [Phrynocephalus forsythii]|uniref:A kinase-anchoring proteins AKAP-5 and AKAP-12 calmodulin (CaM)-binding domain-containing protein n=1 Tax=Phrynocephalus forsythii TaxID=171643 RepID=A0A9Q0Y462_9SAUR|nr:hypothetical protein JRQ81_008457 [Phrynocephalus forsythii]